MEPRHTFACKLCDLTFSTKFNFERHFESKKHVEVLKTLDSLVRIEASIERILIRNKLTGQKGSPFSCISKDLVSSEESERKNLANVWSLEEISVHGVLSNKRCSICSKMFERISNLNSHLKVHRRERKFTCDICGQSFKYKHVLNRHQTLKHEKQTEKTNSPIVVPVLVLNGVGTVFDRSG